MSNWSDSSISAPVYWTGLCGEDSPFWDESVTWDTDSPDLTACFQRSVLQWLPCGYLWLASLITVLTLRRAPSIHFFGTMSKLNMFKMICGVLLCFVVSLDLFQTLADFSGDKNPEPIMYLHPSINIVTMVLATFMMHYLYRKGLYASGILFIFWLLIAVCGIFPFRSYITHGNDKGKIVDKFRFGTFFTYYGLVLIELILHLFADSAVDVSKSEKEPLLGSKKVFDEPQEKTGDRPECPEMKASFLSRLLFTWITGLIKTGYKRAVVESDLWSLLYTDMSKHIYTNFRKSWSSEMNKYKKSPTYKYSTHYDESLSMSGTEQMEEAGYERDLKGSPSLWSTLISVFGFHYVIVGGLWKLFSDAVLFISPQLLSLLLEFVEKENPHMWQGYFYVVLLFLSNIVKTITMQHYGHVVYRSGMNLRSAVIAAVYRKSIILSSAAKKSSTVGEIVNLMSVDAQKLQDAPLYLHNLWSAPVTIAVAMVFLYQQLGPAVFAGLGVMIIMVPVNLWIAIRIRGLQYTQMKLKDGRIKLMSEVLNGIKVLKLYAWELSFQKQITGIRDKELAVLKTAAYLNALSSLTWFCAPFMVSLTSFAVFVMLDPETNILTPQKAFVSLSLFNLMNMPLTLLPACISYGVQAAVSVSRINKFLQLPELDPSSVQRNANVPNGTINIDDGTFSWGRDMDPVLKNMDLQIERGKLVAVVGKVGSGKSSLASSILGELDRIKGTVTVKGSVAYVPQQAWIQNETLKNNIVFGRPVKQTFYDKCIDSCALLPDLKILPGGDQIEIGEKGINVSGGQKQRISLARAVYHDSDIYLMDDPLSAVDAHVGKHIFDNVIGPKGILKDKTRVLITNGITFLPQCDLIVVLNNNCISETGTYQELLSHNGAFAEFLKTYLQEECEDSDDADDDEVLEQRAKLIRQISLLSGEEGSAFSSVSEHGGLYSDGKRKRKRTKSSRTKSESENDFLESQKKLQKQTLTYEEKSETGNIQLSVFMAYLMSVGFWASLGTISMYLCYLGCAIGASLWLSEWSNDYAKPNSTFDRGLLNERLGVYGAFGGGQAIFVLIESLCLAFGTIESSRILHTGILKNVLRAPMMFFDTTPLGRILNRFSKDVDVVDNNIPITLRIWLMVFASVISTFIVISIATPIFLAVAIPILVLYYFSQRFYIATSRQLKRIDSVTRSPIYSHFSETIVGATSIRAYEEEKRFIGTSDKKVDLNQMAYYPYIVSNRWIGVILEFIGTFIVLFASLFAVISKANNDANAGEIGLSVSYALQVTSSVNYLVRMTCDFETYVVAVERIQEYKDVKHEAQWDIEATRPDPSWPPNGRVELRNYSTRYRPGLDLVLKDVDTVVNPGEKVGIVGRTGAGKSSLTLSLFRIIEAAGGSIIIDGVDIAKIGLHQLRSKLTIIPQEPVLFSGTLRMNLDPFDEEQDDILWTALEHAHLKEFIAELPDGLAHMCSEGGENLSVGQRQLICLARALIRKTKVLILDEATAAVDMETDDLIQSTIRTKFNDCTVLTIAHRLHTIMDYDRIIVLDNGRIKEFSSPSVLLDDSKSLFYGMARDAGLV